ncbi:hypothetical protein CDAR_384971 [Caerostris darwini]|uniref:Uncharacterized protein n=1 Tax=Caerostris darwini TaxID=1538125 RepID=A0AAV4WF61_9ARAC|nr:hypothetical protein CDAR_384971 [Caerostris darwini]
MKAWSFRVVDALWPWHREDTSSSNDSLGKKARHNSEAEDLQLDQQRGPHQQISSCEARFYRPPPPPKGLHPIKQIEMTSATISNPGRFKRKHLIPEEFA